MPEHKYILDDKGNPITCNDVLEWAKWFESAGKTRIVNQTVVDDVEVSTVFLGLDHSFGVGEPLIYETMVFENKLSEYKGHKFRKSIDEDGLFARYSTKEQAIKGHNDIVELVKQNHGQGL